MVAQPASAAAVDISAAAADAENDARLPWYGGLMALWRKRVVLPGSSLKWYQT